MALAIALAPGLASAQEADTLTISSTFYMDWLNGTVGPDLAEVYTNGHEHSWTLTLHGTTKSHDKFIGLFGVTNYTTEIHATSFELEFSGPDAATLNGIVSNHIAGGDVSIYLRNAYSSGIGNNFAIVYVWPMGPDVEFFAGHDTFGSETLFPTDADGYPVLGPEPFSIWTEYSQLEDRRPGNDGSIGSWESLVTFEVMPDAPPLTITSSNNVVIVSWPSPSTGFSLQQNNQFNTTNWVTPTETVTDNGTIKFITVDPPMGNRFYRLFKPAQETGTVTITGTFMSDSGEHTWALTLYGTTHSHSEGLSNYYTGTQGWYSYYTDVQATSFDLRFFGPDADDLNRVASEQFAGGKAGLQLRNTYDSGYNLSTMALWVSSPDESATFRAGNDGLFTGGVFPSDADGYPIVTPEPFPFWNEATHISWYGEFFADSGPDADFFPNAQISGRLGQPPPPAPLPTLGIGDASVVEGDRGSSTMRFTVSRSGSRFRTVSVSYRTVDGTASATSDYSAASGTLTFPTGISTLTITIAVTGDHKREPNETFTVELFNAVGASVADAVATGTILNDD